MEYKRLLRRYLSGEDVLEVKRKLVELGYLSSATHNRYGNDTYRAVKAFQEANNLKSDGIVGRETWALLFNGNKAEEPKITTPVTIPSHITKVKATQIAADLAKTSDIRKQICLEALNWAIDPNNPLKNMKCFYIRGGNLYNTDLKPNLMTEAKLNIYFKKAAYAPYYDQGRDEIMRAQAKDSNYTIAGADCSGTVVGIWRKLKVKTAGFDASANGLYNSFCVETFNPQPGDLAWRNGHIGIYVGGGYIVENIGGAYGCQLTKASARKAYNYQDKKLHTFSAWTAFGDPKCY